MTGAKIKAYINKHGVKASVIAKKANIPVKEFSAMLDEKRKITSEEYLSICEALNVPLIQFM